jgi:S1-C subfamily serine protease
MVVPIDLLKPIYEDLLTLGRRNQPPRPWLGLYATEVNDRVVVVGMSSRGPGNAGVDVPLTVYRDGKTFELKVPSADRRRFLKAPRLH